MFIFRRVNSNGTQSNQILGKSYNVVTSWNEEKEFQKLVEPWPEPNEIFAFIVHNEGKSVKPLYKKSEYYLMCSDGKTFDKITFK